MHMLGKRHARSYVASELPTASALPATPRGLLGFSGPLEGQDQTGDSGYDAREKTSSGANEGGDTDVIHHLRW
jgi:hypothetical protein